MPRVTVWLAASVMSIALIAGVRAYVTYGVAWVGPTVPYYVNPVNNRGLT
jgi:hypothetical protein